MLCEFLCLDDRLQITALFGRCKRSPLRFFSSRVCFCTICADPHKKRLWVGVGGGAASSLSSSAGLSSCLSATGEEHLLRPRNLLCLRPHARRNSSDPVYRAGGEASRLQLLRLQVQDRVVPLWLATRLAYVRLCPHLPRLPEISSYRSVGQTNGCLYLSIYLCPLSVHLWLSVYSSIYLLSISPNLCIDLEELRSCRHPPCGMSRSRVIVGYGSEPCPAWNKDLHSADYDKRCPHG